MSKILLNIEQIQQLITHNRYKVDEKHKYVSRCVDGRYENEENLPALAIPGADLGEVGLIAATGTEFGFEVDVEKTFVTLQKFLGGIKNIRFHTDSHADPKIPAGGCGHVKQMMTDFEAYKLTSEQVKELRDIAEKAKKNKATEVTLYGEHEEGAILIVNGNYAVWPRFRVESDEGEQEVQVFVFHKTLVDERHRLLAQKLIDNDAVKLCEGCDAEYLYEVLSNMTETHFFETAKRLARGLPLYNVMFKESGEFKVTEIGTV